MDALLAVAVEVAVGIGLGFCSIVGVVVMVGYRLVLNLCQCFCNVL